MKPITCNGTYQGERCGRTLSVRQDDGSFEMSYKKRRVNFWPPARVTCQQCGFTNVLDKEAASLVG